MIGGLIGLVVGALFAFALLLISGNADPSAYHNDNACLIPFFICSISAGFGAFGVVVGLARANDRSKGPPK
jgi:hypothetical protein